MPNTALRLLLSFVATVLLVSSAPVVAVQRTFVASVGLPANTAFNCSLAKPCRAFNEALSVTSPNGEVIVLDSAGYGTVTITQSVSIIAPPGIYAGVSVTAGDGITINGAGVVVKLKGLAVNGQGGNDGIVFLQGTRLTIEGGSVSGMTGNGINVTAASAFTAIDDVAVSGNGVNGIVIVGDTRASVVRTHSEGNMLSGFLIADGATVTIRDSDASKNIFAGVRVQTGFAATTTVSIDGFTAAECQEGIDVAAPGGGGKTIVDVTRANLSANGVAGLELYGPSAMGSAIVTLTDSLVAGNQLFGITMAAPPATPWSITLGNNRIVNTNGPGIRLLGGNGVIMTRSDNTMSGNAPNVSGALTPLAGI